MRIAFVVKLALVVAVGVLLTLPAIAAAVLSGANGRIVYISGRGYTDAQAKLYLRVASGSSAFGITTGPLTMSAGQHRHPTWSPDRTAIAYSLGGDIFTLDLTNRFALPQKLTSTAGTEDRPAWSPDGTRIAYEATVAAQQDIMVHDLATKAVLNLTNASAQKEGKPAWSPDSQTVYYAFNDNADIYKEPANNSQAAGTPVLNSGTGEFQPSISPDGAKMCYTRNGFDGTSDVYVTSALGAPGAGINLTADNVGTEPQHGDYNCTWSPDGTLIAYVRGTFGKGDLFVEKSDNSEATPLLGPIEGVPDVFDGNPDWAPDGRPTCDPVTVNTDFGQPVTIPIECLDSGPLYERTFVREFVSTPENGTVGDVEQGDQGPSTVVYTPNAGFSGTDTFVLSYFDEIAGFGEPKTVTVNVAAPPPLPKAPTVGNVKATPRKAKVGAKLTVRWTLDEEATTKLTFQRAPKGKKGKRRRFVTVGAVDVPNGKAGANALSLPGGRLNRRKLAPGRYRVSVQARDADNLLSNTALSSIFQIVPKKG